MLKAFGLRNLINNCNNLIKKSNFLSKINMEHSLSTDTVTLNNGNGLMVKKENSTADDVDVVANKKIKLDQKEEVVNNLNDINTTPASVEKSAIKKRKYALLIGYCGEGYFGLQR
jgi:hypothetical protein